MCVLYGREGYHSLFLKPLAYLLGCKYVALDYMALYEMYLKGRRGVYYVEEPWVSEGEAPEPPYRLPPRLDYLRGKMLPVLGNAQVYFKAAAGSCLGLLAKPGEPLVTDFFLPLYLQYGDVERALDAALEAYPCAARSREELIDGVGKRYDRGVIWLAWTAGAIFTTPPWGFAISGVWGLTWVGERPREVHAYAYPPPYLELNPPQLYINAVSIRGPKWMKYVTRFWRPLYMYLEGRMGRGEILPLAREIEDVLQFRTCGTSSARRFADIL
ncbi:MAG: hypothetical protein ACK4SY_07965 [Pyrobaculum sp.]